MKSNFLLNFLFNDLFPLVDAVFGRKIGWLWNCREFRALYAWNQLNDSSLGYALRSLGLFLLQILWPIRIDKCSQRIGSPHLFSSLDCPHRCILHLFLNHSLGSNSHGSLEIDRAAKYWLVWRRSQIERIESGCFSFRNCFDFLLPALGLLIEMKPLRLLLLKLFPGIHRLQYLSILTFNVGFFHSHFQFFNRWKGLAISNPSSHLSAIVQLNRN